MKWYRGLTRVEMKLRHVAYLSYLIPAPRVRRLVPYTLPLSIVDENKVFVSIVTLQSRDVRLASFPLVRFNYNQLNMRTYVKDPHTGNQAVYFLKSGVTSAPISILTRILGPSWQKVILNIEVNQTDPEHYHHYFAFGQWYGDFHFAAEEIELDLGEITPFDSVESATNYLIRPLIGFYGPQGRIGRFEISHPHIEPRAMRLLDFRWPVLDAMGLVSEDEVKEPHNVLLVPESRFSIFLPARRVIEHDRR
jgi:hypothetical protein